MPKKLRQIRIILFFGALWILSSCNYQEDKDPDSRSALGVPPREGLSFALLTEKVLRPRCLECHSGQRARNGFDLSFYASAMKSGNIKPMRPKDSEMYLKVESEEMPPKKPLSAMEKDWIYEWILQGAKP